MLIKSPNAYVTQRVLFELGFEELPSNAVQLLGKAFADVMAKCLTEANLHHDNIQFFSAPRRLALIIHGLQNTQDSQKIVRRGPAYAAGIDSSGQPTPALMGFAKACGVDVRDLTTIKTEKGDWWGYDYIEEGKHVVELLPAMLQKSMERLPIAKLMRWGNAQYESVRPLHWLVALLGNEVIPCTLLGIASDRFTYGHRFHYPTRIEISHAEAYEDSLKRAYVLPDFSKRRDDILAQSKKIADEINAEVVLPDALLDEITSIVEWPQALLVPFDQRFLEVPSEALIAAMQVHQKSIALIDTSGKMLPYFIVIANIVSRDPTAVIAGNEKVMRARLSDAVFFYESDKHQPLIDYADATERVVFQASLGTLANKVSRMRVIMHHLARALSLDSKLAERALALSKCDLMTGMVGEFPELEGIMGYYYASNDGESEAVALALREQYLPRFAGDDLPTSDLGLALSLADRLDTLLGIFMIGQRPSGVKDPFKLRRHALAVARMLMSIPISLSLHTLLDVAHSAYEQCEHDISHDVQDFILDRLKGFYQQQGITSDVVNAVFACQKEDLYDLNQRVHALVTFIKTPDAGALSAACKRVNNVLQSIDNNIGSDFTLELCVESEERVLYASIEKVKEQLQLHYTALNYAVILQILADLRQPIDAFFDNVRVIIDDENLHKNRVGLLRRLQTLLQGVADISLLQSLA